MMNKRLTFTRLATAIVSMALEQVAIWLIWRWVLPEFGIELAVQVLIGIMAGWAVIGTLLFIFTTSAMKKQVPAGLTSMVGMAGKASTRLAPEGMVKIKGELWGARSTGGDIESGEDILVTGEERLKLLVRQAGDNDIKR
jgi:membrane-bound ClpP family serine protease